MTILLVEKDARALEALRGQVAALRPDARLLGFTDSPEALAAAREKARRWLRDWGGATAGAASDALWNGRPRGRKGNGRPPGRKMPEKEPAERRVRLRKTE